MPAKGSPITPKERRRILALHGEGKSRNDIRRITGRSNGAITTIVRDAGLSFDRAATKAATEAKAADNASKRAQLESDLLDDAQKLRKQLWEPCVWGSFGGKDNLYNSVHLDQPTFEQQRAITNAVGNVIDRTIKLSNVGKAADDEEASSLITDLGKALGL